MMKQITYYMKLEFWVATTPLSLAPVEGLGGGGGVMCNVFHTFIQNTF